MILIEDAHGVVHVGEPSTDAVHWTRCGELFNGNSQHDCRPRSKDNASIIALWGRYVGRAPTCLWCVQERQRVAFNTYQHAGRVRGNVEVISRIDFPNEDGS